MKKWMYLIFPGLMLAGFLAIYMSFSKDAELREKARAAEVDKKQKDDKQKKDEAEEKAKKDAIERQAVREADEAKKEADKAAKQAGDDKIVKDETAKLLAKGDAAQKEVSQHELTLDRLHKDKDKASREAFALAQQVELAHVAKRNAEIESQRLVEMISRRAADSSMTRLPLPPPPPPAAK